MAFVAHDSQALAAYGTLHQDKLVTFPRYYAQPRPDQPGSEQKPPLSINTSSHVACESNKAKCVLGLVGQFERRSTEEEQRRVGGPSKAQRTLGLSPDKPRYGSQWRRPASRGPEPSFEQMRIQAEQEIKRMSMQQHMAVDKSDDMVASVGRPQPQHIEPVQISDEEEEEASPADPEKRVFLEISLHESPKQLSFPEAPIELDAGPDHELLIPPRRPRRRPHSYTSPRFSDRPTNKIASSRSRGMSSNSVPPNFSRPLSEGAPKPIPGEDMERDPLSIRFQDLENDPRSPMSPIGGTFVSNEIKAALEKLEMGMCKSRSKSPSIPPTSPPPPPPPQRTVQRRSKARWSSLPNSLLKLTAKKRSSKSEDDNLLLPCQYERKEPKEVVTLTEENLQRWEDEVGYVPKMYRLGYDLLKTPLEEDMEAERATPVPYMRRMPIPRPDAVTMANAAGQMLTPPMSPPTSPPLSERPTSAQYSIYSSPVVAASASASTSTPTPAAGPTPTLSQGSSTPIPTSVFSPGIRSSTTSTLINRFPGVPPPAHASSSSSSSFTHPLPSPSYRQHLHHQASLAAQKEALSSCPHPNQLLTCAVCKEVEHPSAFPAQPLSAACLHAPRVCKECVQHCVERSVAAGSSVKCPECGVGMKVDEVLAVVGVDMLRGIAHRHSRG